MVSFQSPRTLRAACLGPLGSFSHQATLEYFGPGSELLPQDSFRDIFSALQSNEVDIGVVPFENSTNGSVVQTLDLLADRDGQYKDITVCGEHYLTIHQCLLVKKDPDGCSTHRSSDARSDHFRYKAITKLYTHPQVWGQCEIFLSTHFKDVERENVSSTSRAADIVSKEAGKFSAALSSKFAADYFDLDILTENIEDQADNTTRFLVLKNAKSGSITRRLLNEVCALENARTGWEQSHSCYSAKWKTLICFVINHDAPGALADALVVFKHHGMNLTNISSRPRGVRPWQYIFFAEGEWIQGLDDDDTTGKILRDLRRVTETCRHLGSWKDRLRCRVELH